MSITVLIENGEHHINDMVAELDMGHGLGDMLQGRLIDRRARDVIERQCGVDVIDVVQKMEEIQILLQRNASSMVAEPLLHAFHFLCLLLVRVAGIGEQQFGEIALGNVALFVGILSLELERQDFALQLLLEVEEFLDRQLFVRFLAEKVCRQSRVDALQGQIMRWMNNYAAGKSTDRGEYLKRVSCVRMVPMTAADARLVSHESGDLLEFLAIDVSIAIQVKHTEGNLKMTLRS